MALAVVAALAACGSSGPKSARSSTSTSSTTSTSAPPSTTTTTVASSTTTAPPATTSTTAAKPASTTTTTPAPQTVTATSADNGHTIDLVVGDTFKVELSGCGGCGYEWEMTGQPSPVVFRYEGETTSAPPSTTTVGQPPVVGAPVTYEWTFKAVGAHTTGFVAGYYPPSQQKPSQTYTLTLTVKP